MRGSASRVTVVLLASIFIAFLYIESPETLFQLVQRIFFYIAPPFAVVFLLGLIWRRANATAAVWTIVLGGGPLKGGRVVGESDELGYAPKSRPVTPAEVAATLYKGLGLDPHHDLPGPQGRPIPLADYSVQPIKELF